MTTRKDLEDQSIMYLVGGAAWSLDSVKSLGSNEHGAFLIDQNSVEWIDALIDAVYRENGLER